MRVQEVESSSIRAIGCDPEKYEVWVEFLTRPGPYVYLGVPPEVYDELEQIWVALNRGEMIQASRL